MALVKACISTHKNKVKKFCKNTCLFQIFFVPLHSLFNRMNALSDTLYYAMQSLETQLAMQNMCRTGWPCRQIVRTGMDIAGMMLGDDEVEEHREAYISLVCRRLCGDTRETMLTLIMMTALFNLMPTDHQARRCKSILSDQWADDIYDIYHTLCKAVDTQIDGLLEKLHAHTFSISVMKSEQPQTIINVAGNYIAQQNIDIHDNNNCNIYATAEPKQEAQPTMPDNCIPIPADGKYTEVRRYIEERKLNDPDFKTYCDTHSRTELCQRLSREFGWVVDDHSLGRNINRNR